MQRRRNSRKQTFLSESNEILHLVISEVNQKKSKSFTAFTEFQNKLGDIV